MYMYLTHPTSLVLNESSGYVIHPSFHCLTGYPHNIYEKIDRENKNKKCRFGRRLSTYHACSYPGVRAGWPKTHTAQVLDMECRDTYLCMCIRHLYEP